MVCDLQRYVYIMCTLVHSMLLKRFAESKHFLTWDWNTFRCITLYVCKSLVGSMVPREEPLNFEEGFSVRPLV